MFGCHVADLLVKDVYRQIRGTAKAMLAVYSIKAAIVYKDRVTVLKEHCDAIGRDPTSLRLTWFGRLAVSNSEVEAEALSGGKWTKERALVGTPTQVVKQLQQFIELGVDYFMVEVLGLSNPDIMRIVLEEVLPIVSR